MLWVINSLFLKNRPQQFYQKVCKLQAGLLFLLFGVSEQTPSLILGITLNTTSVFESTHICCGNLLTQSEACSVDRQQQRRQIVPVLLLQVEFKYGNLFSRRGALTRQATNVTTIERITRNNDNYPLRWTSLLSANQPAHFKSTANENAFHPVEWLKNAGSLPWQTISINL